ncbi:hypothetical protein NQ317_006326 [Molorchus minor]|uniref:rRNA biogenesis protein RRP36 n=1 Tax=Molorchus minor TaxID=1323400 RepID=A0ABQ9IPK2_9CUCU|nr:hypothetical protein NQ317_006326 [Molorchus minor]
MSQELNNSNILPAKRSFPRDPRFDPLCGQFDDNTFKANYSFINDIRQKEKKQLEKELKNCTDERKKTIMFLLQRMDNQLREAKKKTIEDKKKV